MERKKSPEQSLKILLSSSSMEKKVVEKLMSSIKKDLRERRRETYYATSKASGLRPEVIKKLEAKPMQGKAESLATYINSYCSRFPNTAYHVLYDLAVSTGQGNELFEDE